MIPATPAKTGGAGTGNLNAANTTPHPKPVSIDRKISFIILFHSLEVVFLILYMLLKYFSWMDSLALT